MTRRSACTLLGALVLAWAACGKVGPPVRSRREVAPAPSPATQSAPAPSGAPEAAEPGEEDEEARP